MTMPLWLKVSSLVVSFALYLLGITYYFMGDYRKATFYVVLAMYLKMGVE